MTPDLALLEAVRDRPEDDLPRLVYADWCDENGQPERAEFIRVQCELAKLAEDDPRRDVLVKRQDELHSLRGAEWSGPLAAQYANSVTFDRGFADQIFLNLIPENRHPIIRPLADTLATAAVTALSVWVGPQNPFVLQKLIDRMTGWPVLRSIRRLNISPGNRLRERHLRQLLHNPHLSGVKEFQLNTPTTAADLSLFATATFARRLSQFQLQVDGDRGEWCRAWVRLPFVQRLVELDISGGGFDDSHLSTFLTADLIRVTAAILSSNQLTDRAFDLLVRWPGSRRLTRLYIQGNQFGPYLLSRLVDLPLGQFHELSVSGYHGPTGELAEGEWRRFAESPLADRLTRLGVSDVRSGSSFAHELSGGTFRSLSEFRLWDTPLDPTAFRTLVKAPWIRQLRVVLFSECSLDDEHVDDLLHAEVNDQVFLGLWWNQFSDAGKQRLRDHFGSRVSV